MRTIEDKSTEIYNMICNSKILEKIYIISINNAVKKIELVSDDEDNFYKYRDWHHRLIQWYKNADIDEYDIKNYTGCIIEGAYEDPYPLPLPIAEIIKSMYDAELDGYIGMYCSDNRFYLIDPDMKDGDEYYG